jgi:hypothetical protein
MASEADTRRVEVGFSGGQVLSVRLTQDSYEDLRKAVRDASGWYELQSEDGVIALDIREVVFVKGESSEHRVGFSGA